jgi:Tol biopolymer transport system component
VFFVDRTLKRIDAAGGSAVTLYEGAARMFSPAAWNQENVILFTGAVADGRLRILRIDAGGGNASAATSFHDGEVSHAQPFFLPDGNRFLFRVNGSDDVAGIYVGSLDSGERVHLIRGNASLPAYGDGYLLYVSGTTLMAHVFDADRLELSGDATPVAPSIRTGGAPSAGGSFSVSQTGVLVYQADTAETSQLVWLDRSGRETGAIGDLAEFGYLQMDPTDARVAVSITDPDGSRDVWLYDTARGISSRFTSDPADEFSAAWAPSGQSLAFASARDHAEVPGSGSWGLGLFQKPTVGGGKETLLVRIGGHEMPTSWSPDGRFLIYQTEAPNADLWVLPMTGERKPIPFLVNTRFSEQFGDFSPNGRWIAYTSNETGRTEVYVAPFQRAGATTRISTAGGGWPKWRRDGREIFYVAGDTLTAVPVRENASQLEFGLPEPVFQTRFDDSPLPFAVTTDGQRFLVNRTAASPTQAALTLIVNWTALLQK